MPLEIDTENWEMDVSQEEFPLEEMAAKRELKILLSPTSDGGARRTSGACIDFKAALRACPTRGQVGQE